MADFGDLLKKSRGYDAFKHKEIEVERKQKEREDKVWVNRFWLRPEQETRIIFLDDDPIVLEEHQMKLNGDWRNWFTCLKMLNQHCVLCDEIKDTPSTVGFYTILDLTEYTNKKGEKVKSSVKLFTPKFKALQLIKRQSQKRGGLELCMFDVYRSSADAFNVGDSFEYIDEEITWEDVKALNPDAKVFDYAEILAPKTNEEIRKILNKNTQDNLDSGTDELDEEDVAF